ncbi:glycogen debranching enzyme [Opitutaceae bacterium TAV1]|nr:glycogen debranching enzyme [Opitutaceae bacterium TAV1]
MSNDGQAIVSFPRAHPGVRQIIIEKDPFPTSLACAPWEVKAGWPACWIIPSPRFRDVLPDAPDVALFRLRFPIDRALSARIHTSANERYELWLDGNRIARGPARGDAENWFFETCEIDFTPGTHVFVARVWTGGEQAPFAQLAFAPTPAFILASDNARLNRLIATGTESTPWRVARLDGYTFKSACAAWRTGARIRVEGDRIPRDWESGGGDDLPWQAAAVLRPGNNHAATSNITPQPVLRPTLLPPQVDRLFSGARIRHVSAPPGEATDATLYRIPLQREHDLPGEHPAWQSFLDPASGIGPAALTLPPRTRRRVLIDCGTYLCAYPELHVSGGRHSRLRLHWAESLYEQPAALTKGDRSAVIGKFFTIDGDDQTGIGDDFLPDGDALVSAPRRLDTLGWSCGRYIELLVETADAPLALHALRLHETRYPLENEAVFSAADARLVALIRPAFRTLQMCAHETWMDCPFYEQLQYIGDARIQSLVTYVTTRDSGLPRKAIGLFDASRLHSVGGLTQSRYPSRSRHIIPPFSLIWIGMVHDYALWRGDLPFVRERMPGVRTVAEAHLRALAPDGLLGPQPGWNFVDWASSWRAGIPPGAEAAPSAPLNLLLLLALRQAADLEAWLDEPEFAARHRRHARALAGVIDRTFWSEARGAWADDPAHRHFSEHTQSLALLAPEVFPSGHCRKALTHLRSGPSDFTRCTLYFSHYKLEALHRHGCDIVEHLEPWFAFEKQGFVTMPETPEPSRSDCHAWAAHPLYHFFASILGIRPTSPGFRTYETRSVPGRLEWVEGTMPHPDGGEIHLRVECEPDSGMPQAETKQTAPRCEEAVC